MRNATFQSHEFLIFGFSIYCFVDDSIRAVSQSSNFFVSLWDLSANSVWDDWSFLTWLALTTRWSLAFATLSFYGLHFLAMVNDFMLSLVKKKKNEKSLTTKRTKSFLCFLLLLITSTQPRRALSFIRIYSLTRKGCTHRMGVSVCDWYYKTISNVKTIRHSHSFFLYRTEWNKKPISHQMEFAGDRGNQNCQHEHGTRQQSVV